MPAAMSWDVLNRARTDRDDLHVLQISKLQAQLKLPMARSGGLVSSRPWAAERLKGIGKLSE
jgi:hypothetical protein